MLHEIFIIKFYCTMQHNSLHSLCRSPCSSNCSHIFISCFHNSRLLFYSWHLLEIKKSTVLILKYQVLPDILTQFVKHHLPASLGQGSHTDFEIIFKDFSRTFKDLHCHFQGHLHCQMYWQIINVQA